MANKKPAPKKPAPKKAPAAPKQPKLPKLNDQAGYGHSPKRIVRV